MSTEVENQVIEEIPASAQENAEAPESSTAEDQEVKEPVAKTFTQEELNDIVQREKAKAEAKAERKALRAYRETIERQVTPQQAAQTQDRPPSRDNFANDEAWLDARDAYRDAKRDAQVNQERQQVTQAQLTKKTEGIYAQAEKITGFDRDAFDELPITPSIASALIESEIAPEMMHFMANNPDEVERISALSPARQAAELGKLEVKLQTASVKSSKAPAPITPIGNSGSKQGNNDLSKMSMEDYMAARAKQGSRWIK